MNVLALIFKCICAWKHAFNTYLHNNNNVSCIHFYFVKNHIWKLHRNLNVTKIIPKNKCFFEYFPLGFWSFCHKSLSFEEVYIPFKCFSFFSNLVLFFQKLSKFVDPLSFNIIFRFDLHHIQMDATQFSYWHGVLMYITTNHSSY